MADGTTATLSEETGESETTAGTKTTVPEPEQTLKAPNAYIVSQLKVPGQAIDVKVSGNYAYLTNDLGILYVIDVSDRSNPKVVGKCTGIDSANIVSLYRMIMHIFPIPTGLFLKIINPRRLQAFVALRS